MALNVIKVNVMIFQACVCARMCVRENVKECTFGLNMYLSPSAAPSRVRPRIKKHSRTTYGKTEEKYITCTTEQQLFIYVQYKCIHAFFPILIFFFISCLYFV